MILPPIFVRLDSSSSGDGPDPIETWTKLLLHSPEEAQAALMESATNSHIPLLFELLRDTRFEVSYRAANVLATMQASPWFALAFDSVLSRPPEPKGEIPFWEAHRPWQAGGLTNLVRQLNHERAAAVLKILLGSEKPERRAWAARLAPQLLCNRPADSSITPRLLDLIEEDHLTQEERLCAIEALEYLNANGTHYERAADALRRHMDLPALRAALESLDDAVALEAARALSITGDFGDIAAARLVVMMQGKKAPFEELGVLSLFGPYAVGVAPSVFELLGTSDHALSQAVKHTLIHFGVEAIPLLVRRLPDDTNARVSARITRIFKGMLEEPRGRQLFQLRATSAAFQASHSTILRALQEAAAYHPHSTVRDAAQRALDDYNGD